MSASSYAHCPNCWKENREYKARVMADVLRTYGKVTEKEYRINFESAQRIQADPLEETLREDYDLGVGTDGYFEVSYTGHCSNCGFHYEFKARKKARG